MIRGLHNWGNHSISATVRWELRTRPQSATQKGIFPERWVQLVQSLASHQSDPTCPFTDDWAGDWAEPINCPGRIKINHNCPGIFTT